ncbi:MAG: hypothetical protein V4466_01800 [Pseudomonadota bacterium]
MTGGFLLAGLAWLSLAGEAPAASTPPTPAPATCTAASIADAVHNGFLDPELEAHRATWNALAFRQKDGPLRTFYEAVQFGGDPVAARRTVRACKAIDPTKSIPVMPAALKVEGATATCGKAIAALVMQDLVVENATRESICRDVDVQIAAYGGIMDDLEAGRLPCEDPRENWVVAGDMAMILEAVAVSGGCRNGTVNPTMAMRSPIVRR